jgi:hypothetical protein
MASARDEIASFGAILGRRLQGAATAGQSAAAERDRTPASESAPEATTATCVPPDTGARERPPAREVEAPSGDGRPFERLRAVARTDAARRMVGLAGVDVDRAASVLPLDVSKTFVGPNATYYDECWRLMEWRGRNRSWNWAAALTLGGWLAYRRLYGYAFLHSVWLGLLLLLAMKGTSILLLASLQLALALMLGRYGNALYRRRFRKAALAAAQHDGEHAARLTTLAARGGVDPRAVWILGLALVLGTALVARFADSIGGVGLPV